MSNSKKDPNGYIDKCPLCHSHLYIDYYGTCLKCFPAQASPIATHQGDSDVDANDITLEQEAERFANEQSYQFDTIERHL